MDDEHQRPDGHPSVPRVLSISEVLACIFKELDNASCAIAARVCRTWVEVALDVLWETLESPRPIMALLGPIKYDQRGWDWEKRSPKGDWARFTWYTKRVRCFSYDARLYDAGNGLGNHFGEKVPAKLRKYVASNHGAHLLPENQKLRWFATTSEDVKMIYPFLTPTLREFDYEGRGIVAFSANQRLFRTLHAVLPYDIVSFRWVTDSKMGAEFEQEMANAIIPRSNLRSLRIPLCSIWDAMLKPTLRVLEAEFNGFWDSDPAGFFTHLSDNCPLIEDLRILTQSHMIYTVESIRPLFRCSKLRSLELTCSGAVDLQEEHIREMASAWRDIEALHLCSRQSCDSESPGCPTGTPISSLVTFAQAFSPKLRKLAIYIDSSDPPPPPHPPICFANLEFFSVGTSELGHSEEGLGKVARFLGAILPPQIDYIHSNLLSFDYSMSIFKSSEDGQRTGNVAWDALSEMLQTYRQASSDVA